MRAEVRGFRGETLIIKHPRLDHNTYLQYSVTKISLEEMSATFPHEPKAPFVKAGTEAAIHLRFRLQQSPIAPDSACVPENLTEI